MMQLLQTEIYKVFRRPRTYIAFAVITLIILLIQVALMFDKDEFVGIMLSGMNESMQAPADEVLNGYSVCYIILNLLLVHVPILVALVAGDMISGEAAQGTLRILASKPVSRNNLLFIKFIAASIYTFLLLVWVAILALGLSMLLFGTNQLFVSEVDGMNVMDAGDVLWRYFAAFGFALIGLFTVAALAFMLSAFTENSIVPIVTTVCIVIIFTILNQLQIPFYDTIRPYLFTTHMIGWKGLFYVKGLDGETIEGSVRNISAVLKSAGILIAYTALFLFVAFWHFKRKNILT
jgi:ABC-2 type transport system permease protein